jgi:hypothetical protein
LRILPDSLTPETRRIYDDILAAYHTSE